MSGSQSLAVDVVLAFPHPDGVERFLADLYNPSSSSYGLYLDPTTFRKQFGPSETSVRRVEAVLQASNLVTALDTNGYILHVHGAAAGVESAFGVVIDNFHLGTGRVAHANISLPHLPVAIAQFITGLVGLSDVDIAHPNIGVSAQGRPVDLGHVVTAGPQPCNGALSTGGYTADVLANAYGFSGAYRAGYFGQGQSIALVELGAGWNPSDIATYQSCYGTHSPTGTYWMVDGGSYQISSSNNVEVTGDIEDVMGLAPQATVVPYIAPDASALSELDTLTSIANRNAEQTVSDSWSGCSEPPGVSQVFQEMAADGQSVFVGSGDTGAYCDKNGTFGVGFPAGDPYATGVGGTVITALGPPPVESAWNSSAGASGGGFSTSISMPSYQLSYFGITGQNNYGREVPDVAASAVGYPMYYTGPGGSGWEQGWGTSLAAPLWAALVAVSNSDCSRRFGFANPSLYKYSSSYLHDVTTGSNGTYSAGSGYDEVTGLGTPNGAAFMCNVATPTTTTTVPVTTTTALPPSTTTTTVPVTTTTALPPSTTTTTAPPRTTTTRTAPTAPVQAAGYWMLDAGGDVFSFGSAPTLAPSANGPSVAIAATPDGKGYWVLSSAGTVIAHGDAPAIAVSPAPAVSIASTRDGKGVWRATVGGGVLVGGDAVWYGSPYSSRLHLNAPIETIVATPDGKGYWLLAGDGGVFSYGDAKFFGSTGGVHLTSPVVSMVATKDGHGYWFVTADGGIFTFGDAGFFGSLRGMPHNKPVVGIGLTGDGKGYWMVATDGEVFTFGDAGFVGSLGGRALSTPIVGLAMD